jgi:hypothetical protein
MAIQAGETTFYQAKRGIVQDGLVLNLDAAVDASYSGGTTWTNLSGNNNGTLVNMDSSNLIKLNAPTLDFDGTDEYVNLGSAFSNYSVFTTSFWIYYDDLSGSHESPIGDDSQSFDYHVLFYNGSVYLGRNNKSPPYTIGFSHGLSENTWYNWTFTKDSNNVYSFYRNASLLGTDTKEGTTSVQWIGRGFVYDNCKIPVVQVYNRALTSDEVARNYNATRHRFGV